MSIFIVQFNGDLPIVRRQDGCDKPQAFHTLDAALRWLSELFLESDSETYEFDRLPDPEDDLILVWEANPENEVYSMRVVWYFAGWHWSINEYPGANDLEGQGKLPGCEKSLYELAMNE